MIKLNLLPILTIVYKLLEPDTFEVRYIGLTDRTLEERYGQHYSSKKKCHSACWIRSLKNRGLKPIIEEFYRTYDSDEADSIEISLIAYYKDLGYDLTNHEDGGRRTNKIVSERTREKLAEIQRGRKHTDKTRAKMSAAKIGKEVWNKGLVGFMVGKDNPFYGKTHTEEAKSKQSVAKSKTYEVINPEGEVSVITNLYQFCKDKGLPRTTIMESRKGWKCRKI